MAAPAIAELAAVAHLWVVEAPQAGPTPAVPGLARCFPAPLSHSHAAGQLEEPAACRVSRDGPSEHP